MNEAEWVAKIRLKLGRTLADAANGSWIVEQGKRLTYRFEVLEYSTSGKSEAPHAVSYQTDLLVAENKGEKSWIPRLVVECKLGGVTTHDALTYSAKAATHKSVHPYLRYGILMGDLGGPVPVRVVSHAANLDFMMTFVDPEPSRSEWRAFVGVVQDELHASQQLQSLLTDRRRSSKRYHLVHRRLLLS